MPIIRKKLDPNSVYPTDIQYDPDTDTVQTRINDEWVDSPLADPRHQTTLPPRLTADPACDAAKSVTDAFEGQIEAILQAIDNSGTAFTLAGIILGLFTFGVFGIFIVLALAIANIMLDAGTTAIEASLTPGAYEDMMCILFCHMDSQGRITAEGLAEAQADITDQIGGIGATILNAMLSLAGEGGVNNLASLGTATGDCDECGCEDEWCYYFDFALSDGGFNSEWGFWNTGCCWEGVDVGGGNISLYATIAAVGHLTKVEAYYSFGIKGDRDFYVNGSSLGAVADQFSGVATWNIDLDFTVLGFNPSSGAAYGAGNSVECLWLKLTGTGENPFGEDNCP